MSIPPQLAGRLAMPAIVAPMFLISGPDLVVECCRAGLLGTFPSLNQRTTDGFVAWLDDIEARLDDDSAPYGVNLIVHPTNKRLQDDLAVIVARKVPLVITSLGAVKDVVDAVHSYGGLVFHDVISARHAEKAAKAGVDGLIAVAAGAGGHAGTISPFALIAEIRSFFDGALALSGALSQGRQVAAAELMGADYGYLGSLFIAAEESLASPEQKAMMIGARAADIVHTDKVTGIAANFMKASLAANGLLDAPGHVGKLDLEGEARAWKTIWSAGHGVGAVRAVRPARAICEELIADYRGVRHD
ncbi:NAD(P)H-dependent flavin oxidoreductase [Sphingomonas crusticola]|uniref:NAD(P)H-dependent flavin oxidoreductase n=1 Tax=Sphingomonas crusticola TaxID=1697973 RepID=UPI000E22378C|nr:nitronate monooxygenase [Sphingomonas crusticola]